MSVIIMVVQSLDQLERNVAASFGYVKKDLLMLNDAISDINDKIQHLSLNHAVLLEKIQELSKKKPVKKAVKKKVAKKPVKKVAKKTKEEISFYDVKTKKRFKTDKYTIKVRAGRRFAVAKSPAGTSSWRILGAAKTSKTKKKTTSQKAASPKRIVKETIEY